MRLQGMADDEFIPLRTVSVGHGFFATLGVDMLYGRTFDRALSTDSAAYVLNRAAAERFVAEHANLVPSADALVGQMASGRMGQGEIIGIAEDFNMATLHESIEPIMFFILPDWHDHLLLRVGTAELPQTLAHVEQAWQTVYGAWPLSYHFADAAFDAQYRAEERLFSLLAILIACLGLFGLASFTAAQRTKEIGVRKVLGASVPQVVVLLTREFTLLVLAGLAVAAPLGYLAMSRWLDTFAYRIDIAWWVFVLAGLLALSIAWLTVSYQSIRAATADPVRSLRYE